MKKTLTKIAVAIVMAAGISTSGMAQAYSQGDNLLNVGLGIGSNLSASGLTQTLPPIGISYEKGIKDKISVGGYVGMAGASSESFGWKWTYSYIVVGARGSYHFSMSNDKFDPYVGLMAGYNAASVTVTKPAGWAGPDIAAASAGGVIFGGHIGARYYFTEKIGAFAELGYGIALLNVGVTAKF